MHEVIVIPNVKVDFENVLLTKYQEKGYTIIHCEYFASSKYANGGWVTITKDAYLLNRTNNEKLSLLHAINIPIDPEKHFFKNPGERLAFTLIYPQIPSDWISFDFITTPQHVTQVPLGDEVSGWYHFNINRNNSGVYRIKLS